MIRLRIHTGIIVAGSTTASTSSTLPPLRLKVMVHFFTIGSRNYHGHSGLNLNIQIQKLVFRFNSIQVPIIQYSGFIQNVIAWQVLAGVNASESH